MTEVGETDVQVEVPAGTENVSAQPVATEEAASRSPKTRSESLDAKNFNDWYYVELFKLGGGYAFLYATVEFMLEILRTLKYAGVPGVDRMLALWKELQEFPFIGDILNLILGRSSRPSFKFCGARKDDHPGLEDFWKPTPKACPCFGKPEMAEDIGPQHVGKMRATPEFKPFTDFDNFIVANERTDRIMPGGEGKPNDCWALVDQALFFSSRGWRLRFKTEKGGETLFNITRRGPPLTFYACFLVTSVCSLMSGRGDSDAMTCGSPEDGCTVRDADNKTILGYIRPIKHGFCSVHGFFRNRFWKQPKPYYAVMDAQSNTLYEIILPIKKSIFLGCAMWFDEDYFSIVSVARKDEWCTLENEYQIPEAEGWIIAMRPLFQDKIDKCLSRCAQLKKCCGPTCEIIVNLFTSFIQLLRTCPIDNVTQVPNPGTKDLRAATPCTHTLSAIRAKLPEGCPEADRILIKGALIWVETEDATAYI